MTSAVKVLTKVQVGVETTRGTGVAASRRLIADGRYRRQQEVFDFTDQNSGVFARTPRAGVITRAASEIELTTPLDYQQILLPLLSGMVGAVTPTGAGADKTWTFTPSTSAPVAVDTYTVEFVEASPDDSAEMEFTYGFSPEIEVSADTEGISQLRWKMIGRATADSTLTGALSVPTLIISAPPLWAPYMDDTWAGLGTTKVSPSAAVAKGGAYGFRWTYKGAEQEAFYLDGRTTLDFSQTEKKQPEAELELDIVHDPVATGFIQAEEAKKDSQAIRFVEMRLIGAALGGSNYSVKLQGAYYHATDSMEERGSDRDGNLVVRVHLVSAYDPTSTFQSRVIVVNNLTTFPA